MKLLSYLRSIVFIFLGVCAIVSSTQCIQKIDVSGDTVVCFAKQQNHPLSKFIKPLFDQVAAQYRQYGIKFIYVDITQDVAFFQNRFQIFNVPTVVYFKNGFEVYRHDSKNGTIDIHTMKRHVDRIYFV